MFTLAVFLLGAMVGSFLNVCIHRLPSGESIVFPASHCPRCQTAIAPYDNIPLFSYALLRGQCRHCGAPIAWRYPAVELLGGLAAAGAVLHFGLSAHALVAFAFLAALIVVTFIDLDHQIIPDAISLPGIGVGFAAALLLGEPPWLDALLGILIGGGMLWVVAEGYARLTGREGMGGGDIKLLAMIGAFVGWRGVLVSLLIASLLGSVIGIAAMLRRGDDAKMAIPFGPFLAAGAVCALFWAEPLITWYFGFGDWLAGGLS
jgi:leader peptidase (prepilin peptidase)/N-methyltransferase